MGAITIDQHIDPEQLTELLTTGFTLRFDDDAGTAEIEVAHLSDDELAAAVKGVAWRYRPVEDAVIVEEPPVAATRAELEERLVLARENLDHHEIGCEVVQYFADLHGPTADKYEAVHRQADLQFRLLKEGNANEVAIDRAEKYAAAAAQSSLISSAEAIMAEANATAYREAHLPEARSRVEQLERELDALDA